MISAGRVRVNGQVAQLGSSVRPDHDRITVNKDDVIQKQSYRYVLCNKPVGYVCSRQKQGNSPTVYELLPPDFRALKVAGRLDKDSCGLIFLTDDGDTIFELTHPRFKKQKTYYVGLNKPLNSVDKKKIHQGIELEDGVSRLHITGSKEQKSKISNPEPSSHTTAPSTQPQIPNLYIVTMHEGRNRQIRRTFKALGYTVTHLERLSLGKYNLSHLRDKQYLEVQPHLV